MKNNGKISGEYVSFPVCDRNTASEITADLTLPDYYPEIKRLLRVSASVLPPSKYVGERECELAGGIDYYVLYTGNDNAIYLAPLSGEYKIGVPIDSDGEFFADPEVSTSIVPDMISGRVTAPRKASVKCRLRARTQVFGKIPIGTLEFGNDENIQTLIGESSVSRVYFGTSDLINVSDEVICDARDGDIRVIYADGKPLFSEVTAENGAVTCRADVHLKLLLCKDGDSKPYTVVRKIPFSERIAVEGSSVGDSAFAKGSVAEMNITVDDGRIGIALGVIVEAEVCGKETASYVKDVYSTERVTENSYKTLSMPISANAFFGNFTLSDSLSFEEAGIPLGTTVLDVCGVAYPEEYIFDGGRCAVSGKARLSLLLEKDGEYSTHDFDVPFNYRAPASGDFDKAICFAEVVNVRARADGERIGIDAEIGIGGRAYAEKDESMLSDVRFGEKLEKERGEITVCYPSRDDSIWSVAKRYGAPLDRIAETNGIAGTSLPDSPNSLEGMNYLII